MKNKFLFILGSCFIFCSCANFEVPEIDSRECQNGETVIRTESEAAKIAVMATVRDCLHTRNSDFKTVSSVVPITLGNTRSASDTVIYAVQFDNDEGFALISARRDVEPLLAIVDEGSIDSEKTRSNMAFNEALQRTAEYASKPSSWFLSLTDDDTPRPQLRPGYYDTILPRQREEPLVKVRWGQRWPEGIYCPNGIGGCGPVAAVQILSTMNMPKEISYFFPEMDISSETINWPLLKTHSESCSSADYCINYKGCELSAEEHKTLGRLVRQIGVQAEAEYLFGENIATSTTASKVVETIGTLSGKSVISQGNTAITLYNSLAGIAHGSRKRVAYVRGEDNVAGGHAWVADGTWEIGLMVKYWNLGAVDGGALVGMVPTVIRDFARYLHFNWGWNGNCNGYFLVNIFGPDNAYKYDSAGGNYTEEYDFSNGFYYYVYGVN